MRGKVALILSLVKLARKSFGKLDSSEKTGETPIILNPETAPEKQHPDAGSIRVFVAQAVFWETRPSG